MVRVYVLTARGQGVGCQSEGGILIAKTQRMIDIREPGRDICIHGVNEEVSNHYDD